MGLYKLAKAKKEYIDLDKDTRMEITSPADRAAAERIKANIKPMSFGEAFIDSTPAALLAAAVGGLGSAAISEGSLEAAGAGAVGSFLLTSLGNAMANSGKAKMTLAEALQQEGYA